jgi:aspartate/methionine/tyrosine aminotransferase
MSEAEVCQAVDIARRHDLLIISDEIYEPFLYDSQQVAGGGPQAADNALPSPARNYDRTIVLRGFSKSHAMTGWRLGYAVGPDEIIAQMTKLQQYTYVCAPAPLQYAALSVLGQPVTAATDAYRRKRDIAYEVLSQAFDVTRPGGAFYIFPRAPKGVTASEFCTRAIENNVLVIPGNVFSERDTHFRISYATTDDRLRQGCEILCKLAR